LDAVGTIVDEGEVLVEDYLLNGDREGLIRNSSIIRNHYPKVCANHRRGGYDSYRPGPVRDGEDRITLGVRKDVRRRKPLRIERRE
jgi:hypothetical protein